MSAGTILAMGGGGFSMEPDNPLLDDFLLSLVPNAATPRVCFIPTASGDSDGYVKRFEQAFAAPRARTLVLSLFRREHTNLRSFVLSQDIVYIGGATPRTCSPCGACTDWTRSWPRLSARAWCSLACPHYDGEAHRRPTYLERVGTGRIPGGYAADDGCALLFHDGQLTDAVSSRPDARAFRVHNTNGVPVQEPLPVQYLG